MGADEFLDLMPDTVTLEPFSSRDAYGEPSYAPARSHRARIEMKNVLIRTPQGNEAVARGQVLMATEVVPSTKDRLTLPAEFSPTQPPILDVRPVRDEAGMHHVVLMIG